MKKFFLLLLIVSLVFVAAACASDRGAPAAPDAGTPGQEDSLVFAFIIPALDAAWYVDIVDGFRFAAEEVGAEIMVLSSEYDADREIANIALTITEQVDGVVMFSFNETGAALAAQMLEDAGIPLVVPDSVGEVLAHDANIVAAVDFDWYGMGEMYAEWMAENTTGDFAIIAGVLEHFPVIHVNQGMADRSAALGVNNLVQVIAADYVPARAAAAAEDLITGGLDFETIFVMNEDMAVAVVRVLDARGVLNNPYRVITQNGQDVGIELVRQGELSMTISSSPGLSGYMCFRILYSYVHGVIDWTNRQIMIPVAIVDYDAAIDPDPRIVIPWTRNPIFRELIQESYPELIW